MSVPRPPRARATGTTSASKPAARRGARGSAEETRRTLLAAAEHVFGTRGYDATTVEHVVTRARVGRGTFYLYFDNKGDIFEHLIRGVIDAMLVQQPVAPGTSLRARVQAGNLRYLEEFNRHRLLLRALIEATGSNARVAAIHSDIRARFLQRIRAHLERHRALAGGSAGERDRICFTLGMMVEGVAHSWLAAGCEPFDTPFDVPTMARVVTDLWCRIAYPGADAQALGAAPRSPPGGRRRGSGARGDAGRNARAAHSR